jgi:hypothetical protein
MIRRPWSVPAGPDLEGPGPADQDLRVGSGADRGYSRMRYFACLAEYVCSLIPRFLLLLSTNSAAIVPLTQLSARDALPVPAGPCQSTAASNQAGRPCCFLYF